MPRCPLYRRYWGKSGSDSDIAKLTQLTQLRHCNCSRGAPVHRTTIDAINELAEKIWNREGYRYSEQFGGWLRSIRSMFLVVRSSELPEVLTSVKRFRTPANRTNAKQLHPVQASTGKADLLPRWSSLLTLTHR